jgi:hypothetical protein
MPVGCKVLDQTEERNSQTEYRANGEVKHYQCKVNKHKHRAQIVPLESIRTLNIKELFEFFHCMPSLSYTLIVSQTHKIVK